MTEALEVLTPWPDPTECYISKSNKNYYVTPVGGLPRVTSILKVLGLSREKLIAWAASEERKAVIAAALKRDRHPEETDQEYAASIEEEIGPAKQHLKLLAQAADIGSEVHELIRWTLMNEVGDHEEAPGPISKPARLAFKEWQGWRLDSGLWSIKVEQPIWGDGYAGTIDWIAEGPDGLELLDWKTSRGIYPEHHLQVSAYLESARKFAPIKRAWLVRLPKTAGDHLEVRELGDLGSRKIAPADLYRAFLAARAAWCILMEKP